MSRARIAFLSNHISGAVKLGVLLRHGVPITRIVTASPALAEKHRIAGYYDFEEDARAADIPLHLVQDLGLNTTDDAAVFEQGEFDLLLISGWQRLIPQRVLNALKIGAIGEHGSSEYLPRGRGRSPIAWSLLNGGRRFVLHIFRANAEADAGDIIDYDAFEMNPWDDINTIYAKVGLSSGRLLIRNLPRIEAGDWSPLQTAEVAPSFFAKRSDKDDFLDWSSSTLKLHNHVRATTRPYPGAKTRLNGQILTVWRAQPFDYWGMDDFSSSLGEILAVLPDGSFIVKTGDGSLLIREYEPLTEVRTGLVLQ